jgi:hypothetical protein
MNIKTFATAVLAAATSISVNATVLTVTSLANSGPGSLRDLVAASASGDTIQFAVKGTILLNSSISISHTLYVLGPGPSSLVLDAQFLDRVFVTGGNPVFISGVTIVDGLAVGSDGPDATIPGQPGGPGLDGLGGAILNNFNSPALYLSNCWFTGNTARGGRGGNGGNNPIGAATTPGMGGAGGMGGGGAVYATGAVFIANCTFSANRALGGIGGAGGTNENPAVNESGATGGIGGFAQGGAVYEPVGGSPNSFTNVTFSGNFARSGDGGLGGDSANGPGGNGGNSGGAGGGAVATIVAAFSSDTIVTNLAIAGAAGVGGGGVPSGGAGTKAIAIGGGVVGYTITCISDIANTIIADNFSSGIFSNYYIDFRDRGFNYFGTDDYSLCGTPAVGSQQGTVASPLHPQLGPLAQNGSGMPTHSVLLTSPVLDAGSRFGLTNDQRGATRPYDFSSIPNAPFGDGSDMGAFELGSPDMGAGISSDGIVISWPAAYGDFVLQSSSNLQAPESWGVVQTYPTVVSNQFVVTNQMINGSMFYRLLNQPATQ